MCFLVHILKILDIDEEIADILPTEVISFQKDEKLKICDNILDFQILTINGKILIFEFKKTIIR